MHALLLFLPSLRAFQHSERRIRRSRCTRWSLNLHDRPKCHTPLTLPDRQAFVFTWTAPRLVHPVGIGVVAP